MSVGGLILFIAFLVVVVAIVVAPLLRSSPRKVKAQPLDADPASSLIGLEAQHQAILASLRDLDFDFQTGKLAEIDYHTQREFLMQRGADILRQIDLLVANNGTAPVVSPTPSAPTSAGSARKRKA